MTDDNTNDLIADRARRLRERIEEQPTISADEHRRRSRRAFLTFGASAVAAVAGFRYIQNRPTEGNIPDTIRSGLELNEALWTAVGSETATSPTFNIADREDIRVNGLIGLRDEPDPDWRLRVVGVDGVEIESLSLEDLQQLPERNMVWEHKCIEGWANIVHWTGARFSDFAARYYGRAVPENHRYVSFRTPDEEYYVGLDRETALHSQTLLAWKLNDEMLTEGHGAPLRLALPTTYGIKQLKRIGTIEFTDNRPADYWAERGYDWHARF